MNTHLPPLPSGAPEPQTDAPLPPLPEIPPPPPEDIPAPPLPEIPPPPPEEPPAPPLPEIPLPAPEEPPAPPLPEIPLPPPEDIPAPPLPEIPLPAPEEPPLPPLPEIPLPPPEEPPAPPIPIHGQKKQLHWLIPAAAVVVLAAGAGASFCLYTEKQALAERTDHLESHAESLKKDAAALSEQITLLRQKQEEAQKRRILKEEETARLLETLQKKEKETEQLRLEYGAVHTEQDAVRKRIEVLEQELTQITSDEDKRNRGTEGTDTPSLINPPGQETDARLLKAGIDYLKARKLGNASALSEHFAPYCSYQYANNREVPKETVMNDVREAWKKYPRRAYRLLKVAYLGKRVEIIYWYEYVNQKKRTVRGYAREKWEINSIGQIVHWREDTHLQTPPQESPGYRLVPLNIK